MKKQLQYIFFCIQFILFYNTILSAEMPRLYNKQSFDFGSGIIANNDNGFSIYGYFKDLPTDLYNAKVVKFNLKGDEQWTQNIRNGEVTDFSAVDEGILLRTSDSGYLVFNTYPNPANNGRFGRIRKYNQNFEEIFTLNLLDYNLLFDETFAQSWNLLSKKITTTNDGGFIIAGSNALECYNKTLKVIKFNTNGIFQWNAEAQITSNCEQFRYDAVFLQNLNDNGVIIAYPNKTQTSPNVFTANYNFIKLNVNGVFIWSRTINTTFDVSNSPNKNYIGTIKQLPNNNIKIIGVYDAIGGSYNKGTVLQYTIDNASSNLIQTDTFLATLPLQLFENFRKIEIEDNEDIIIVGQKSISKFNKKGQVIWSKKPFDEMQLFDQFNKKNYLTNYAKVNNRYVAIGNIYQTDVNNISDIILFDINNNGTLKTKILSGNIFIDQNNSCTYQTNEIGYPNLFIKATDSLGNNFYTNTDSLGMFYLPLLANKYNITAQMPNNLYWKSCQNVYSLDLTASNSSYLLQIPLQKKADCPFLNVEIGIPYLRKCANNTYTIHYCNTGNTTAQNAYIEVNFDEDLTILNSSIPAVNIGTNKYKYEIGNLLPNTCGSFLVTVNVNCNAINGATHCVEAHIFPDTLCVVQNPLYDGSDIDLSYTCTGDSATVIIKNIGAGRMQQPRKYIVIEGDIMRRAPSNFQLNAGQELMFNIFVGGKTVVIRAEEDLYFPYISTPSITIEGCNGTIDSLNLVNQFPMNDGSPLVAISCEPNKSSFDPNDKRTQPEGFSNLRIIEKNTPLKYTIRFKNTGTDTAFNIFIIDTLSQNVDANTLQMGASSHLYTYEIFSNGVLKVNFNNIKLPDSIVNDIASNGFFNFTILPKSNITRGSIIYNNADIYFDFNAPIKTNTTKHTIDSIQFRILKIIVKDKNIASINIYPNPTTNFANIDIKSTQIFRNLSFKLYDVAGKLIDTKSIQAQQKINISTYENGLYLINFYENEELIAIAKLLKQ